MPPPPAPIALLYALKEEVGPLLRHFTPLEQVASCRTQVVRGTLWGHPVVLCRTGVGRPNAHEGAELLLHHVKPAVVMSIGCAGACQEDLKTGDLILTHEIRTQTPTDRYITDPVWRRELAQALGKAGLAFREGPLVTSWKLAGVSDKRSWGSSGALAVDMETASVATIVRRAQIPFLSLRVIFDPRDEALPFTEPLPEGMHPGVFVLKNPKMILKIPKYVRMNRICQKKLAAAVQAFFSGR